MNKWLLLVFSVIVCQMAGVIGSVFTSQSIPSWYETLSRPWFTPPNWLFAPVWITLFTLMGISLFMILGKDNNRFAIEIFGAQLALNTLWNYLFFGLRSPFYGLIGIIVLWFLILVTILEFSKISKKAGALLIPYIVWVSIATLLNYYVWVLNPGI